MKRAFLAIAVAIMASLGAFAQVDLSTKSFFAAVTDDAGGSRDEGGMSEFTNLSATYTTWFNSFDTGYYGLRYEGFSSNGLMFTAAFKGSWGITDPGYYQYRVGMGKGFQFTDWCALTIPISFIMGDYAKDYDMKKGKIKKGECYGFAISPGLRFKAGKLIIGASFDLGGLYTRDFAFYKAFELSLGFTL